MPKPTTKDQILEDAHKERTALEELLSTLTPEQMTQPNMIGEWAAKDVLSHLMEWETNALFAACAIFSMILFFTTCASKLAIRTK